MAWFRRKIDPIRASEEALNAKIAALEEQIHDLNRRLTAQQSQPRLRSTATPQPPAPVHPPQPEVPAFEAVDHHRVREPAAPETTPAHYNELGIRKYDFMAVVRRWLRRWRGTPAANPKLVNYLAAGSIHGLRPLRYETRIARNRFLALCLFFIAIIWGLVYFYLRNR
ncbi:MAG TPA: hypothetical protein PKM73_07920 [Verrucomicrobiota bacterium]|nr:hypothetical protein [Verrucomicrobiota bacterium]HNU51758.1 hypothetical protein [Verrucomicrobiota bacterium]